MNFADFPCIHGSSFHQTADSFLTTYWKYYLNLTLFVPWQGHRIFRRLTLNSHGELLLRSCIMWNVIHTGSLHILGAGWEWGAGWEVLLTQLSGGWSLTPREELGNGAPGLHCLSGSRPVRGSPLPAVPGHWGRDRMVTCLFEPVGLDPVSTLWYRGLVFSRAGVGGQAAWAEAQGGSGRGTLLCPGQLQALSAAAVQWTVMNWRHLTRLKYK